MTRRPSRTTLLALSLLGACVKQSPPDDRPGDEDLTALLDDGDLTTMVLAAQTSGPGGVAGAMGAGGSTGGSMGSGGSPAVDGGKPLPPPPACPPTRPPMGPVDGPTFVTDAGAAPPDALPPRPRDAGGSCEQGPLGRWDFDDCNTFRTDLRDSTFNGFTAFRSVNTKCVAGIEGQGVSLPGSQDIVFVPDQPAFTFGAGVTVAAWVKPDRLSGSQTIFRKREGDTSSFALMVVGNRFTFVIDRVGAAPVSVSARAKEGVFTHVAATYDGVRLRLFLNGKEADSIGARGRIDEGQGPLLMGNDGNHRRFQGTLDKVFFATAAASEETILGLQCLRHAATLTGSPSKSMPVPNGTPVTFNFNLKNNNTATCPAESFQFFTTQRFQEGFDVQPNFAILSVGSGETSNIPVTITAGDDVDPGEFAFTFAAFPFSSPISTAEPPPTATVTYVVAAGGCRVSSRKELFVRDVSVVDDPVRTTSSGAWTFKHLMEQIAPSAAAAPEMVEAIFSSFTTEQTVNGFRIGPRLGMQPIVLDPWPRKDGKLDLEKAPLRLLAIVNRIDLRNLARGHAGEGRFVFGIVDSFGGFPLQATLILEYHLPARTEDDVRALANAWHALGEKPFPSEEYNAALQAITDGFTRRGAAPDLPNGSALSQLRTNEIDLGFGEPWQLREFNLDAAGQLVPATIKLTPDRATFDGSDALAKFVNENETAIVAEQHDVPLTFDGAPFLSGAVFNDLTAWRSAGITNPEARHKFSLNTCNGCHSSEETGTGFLQVNPRFPGQESFLSGFLTGTTVFDPVTFEPRTFNDLARRNRDLRILVCPPDQIPPLPPPPPRPDGGVRPPADGGVKLPPPVAAPTVARGISRVH